MSKRHRRNRPATEPRRRAAARRRTPRTEEPDLLDRIAATLDDDPLPLLALASTMVAIFDPGTPRYLTGQRRAEIVLDRDHFRAVAD